MAALTLRSSTSLIDIKEVSRTHKLLDDQFLSGCTTVAFPNYNTPTNKPLSCRVRAAVRANWNNDNMSGVFTGSIPSTSSTLLHGLKGGHKEAARKGGVPVYVMLPLDTVSASGGLNRARALNASLMALKSAGVEGVMVDVWWGLVEKEGPMRYNWDAYVELVQMAERHGLKLQMVMSFHQCGGNVGDSCSIPLPPWVHEEMSKNPDIVYTDRSGRRNPEYISLGCDMVPVLNGRTPVQVYSDYMRSFRDKFIDYLGNVIVEIQVGLGPCGELRYPSYPESNGTWRFPGIGEFQCYDKYMKASLEAAAIAAGHKEWGNGGPHDAGNYTQFPEDTGFFKRDGTWTTDYADFFLSWYSNLLIDHGDRILAAASSIFSATGAKLSAKVAGIHWHYRTRSHAAELTAGYYNTRHRDGYAPIASMLAARGAVLNFTCLEMKDEQQPGHANSSPEGLVRQVKQAAAAAGAELAGENALERYDECAFRQVVTASRDGLNATAFTYLRMNKKLFEGENWRQFVEFVKRMSEGGSGGGLAEEDTTHSDVYIGFVTSGERRSSSDAKTMAAA